MLATSLALALLGASAAVAAQGFNPASYLSLARTVIKVEAPGSGGRVNVGTAVTVAPGVVLTNCHVTRDAVSIRVVRRGNQWPATGQYADVEHDLCFLAVPAWRGTPVRFADPGSVRLYQNVVAMGFTRGVEVSMVQGEITGLHEHDGGRIIESTSGFSSGASGGALLDDDGRLVGVLTFRLRGDLGHYFSLPVAWVLARLPVSGDRFQPVGPLTGRRAFWEVDHCCMPYFMRVGGLQTQGRWPELLGLAEEWVAADPADADAWFARGLAHTRMQRPREAVAALARATELAPRHADAWFELGAASLAMQDATGAVRARDALAGLKSDLAGRLSRMMMP